MSVGVREHRWLEQALPISVPLRRGLSKSARVYEDLRAAIVALRLKPGAQLDKSEICRRLNVSRQPVSEAVARLADEHLLEVAPQKGTYVARIRLADVAEAAFVRRALEVTTVAAIAPGLDDAAIEALERVLAYQAAALKVRDWDEFYVFDVRFHAMLFARLGLPRLANTVDIARAPLERARRLLLPSPGRSANTLREHRAIFAALAARNASAAADAMGAHLDQVVAGIRSFASTNPGLFEP